MLTLCLVIFIVMLQVLLAVVLVGAMIADTIMLSGDDTEEEKNL